MKQTDERSESVCAVKDLCTVFRPMAPNSFTTKNLDAYFAHAPARNKYLSRISSL